MKTIKAKIINYEKGGYASGFLADGEYPSEITVEIDGCKMGYKGNSPKDTVDEIKKIAEPRICFDEWFEDNWMKTFTDVNLPAPVITTMEGETSTVNSIDDFINNCKGSLPISEYNQIKDSLIQVASSEYTVEWI